jgi:hypothetical protein
MSVKSEDIKQLVVKTYRTTRDEKKVWYPVGIVSLFPDGNGTLRLFMMPEEPYHLFPKVYDAGQEDRDSAEGVEAEDSGQLRSSNFRTSGSIVAGTNRKGH